MMEARELEVARLAGRPVELDEGHLDLGVAVDALAPVGPRARSTESAAWHAIVEQAVVASARCHAIAAWIRWPTQYSSWPHWRSAYSWPGATTWTNVFR